MATPFPGHCQPSQSSWILHPTSTPLSQPEPAGPAHLALQVLLHRCGAVTWLAPREAADLVLSHQGPWPRAQGGWT